MCPNIIFDLLSIIVTFYVVSVAPIVLKNITQKYVGNFVGKITINSYKIKINRWIMDVYMLKESFKLLFRLYYLQLCQKPLWW